MKKTKIVCTLGPSSRNKKMLTAMVKAGMNVARLNFSHGSYEEHGFNINLIKEVRKELNVSLPIMLDTKGPELRIKTFKNGKVELKEGQEFIFTTDDIIGDEHIVSVSYKGLAGDMKKGDTILLNNGLLIFKVEKVVENNIHTKVIVGGITSDKKSMFVPDKHLSMTYLSEQDIKDIEFGFSQNIDMIACSFVSCAQDILDIRALAKKHGQERIKLIAKIESRTGVDNIDKILAVTDGLMIARGDMGVEIPYEELPHIQKLLAEKCRKSGKFCITATEMLESMITQARPTRAEITDVANAIYDGTSAVMLSGESAAGKYPLEAVQAMTRIAQDTEKFLKMELGRHNMAVISSNDALAHAGSTLAESVNAKLIIAHTEFGRTAELLSRFRSDVHIIGMTANEKTYRFLGPIWGVEPCFVKDVDTIEKFIKMAKELAHTQGCKKGDNVVVISGKYNFVYLLAL